MATAITVKSLLKMKQDQQPIAMMTAYDFPTAHLLDEAGIHVLLVGDSLGMVVQGQTTTLPVTLDDMVYHTRMVARAAKTALVVADLPFMSYQISAEQALTSSARLMKEAGAQAVKLEGGKEVVETVQALVTSGVPVMGHLGLTPQSVHALGGFSVQGRTLEQAQRIFADAQALEKAGAFAIVLEMVPVELAHSISQRLSIPTIGIGAGTLCDGQVLVFHDMTGFTSGYIPRHNKRYANLADIIQSAARQYITDVSERSFPGEEQTAHLSEEQLQQWNEYLATSGKED